jgi:hypothetical protein
MPSLPQRYLDRVNWTDCRPVWEFDMRNHELESLWRDFFVGNPPNAYLVRQALTGKMHGELLGTAAQASARCLKVLIGNDCLYNLARNSHKPLLKAVIHCYVSPKGHAIEIDPVTQTIDFFQNKIGWTSSNRARIIVSRAFGRSSYGLLPPMVVAEFNSLVRKAIDPREDFAAIFAAEVFSFGQESTGFGQEMTGLRRSDDSLLRFNNRRRIIKNFIRRISQDA